MTTPALIFDCDGVLIDSEHSSQLRAFNQMWLEMGVAWEWSDAEYAAKLRISGGKERLDSLYHEPDFRACFPVPDSRAEWLHTIHLWHQRKTEIYVDLVTQGAVSPRSGVRRLAREALAAGWDVAVASSGVERSVRAVVRQVMGPELAERIPIFGGDRVPEKKPAPDIYRFAARTLHQDAASCLVVEDSRNGVLAAVQAGMTCLVTPTGPSTHDPFDEAALVVSDLGDPGGEPVSVLRNPAGVVVGQCIGIEDLTRLLSYGAQARTVHTRHSPPATPHTTSSTPVRNTARTEEGDQTRCLTRP